MMQDREQAEAVRLEELWAGPFGDAYADRNAVLDDRRGAFWRELLAGIEVSSVLEVGCGQGGNLRPIAGLVEPAAIWGIDISATAVDRARANAPGTNIVLGPARDLPFRDRWFDLVFTIGVLIHQPETTLPLVLAEIVRCSRRYVLWAEYHASQATEVPYHDASGALFKRDYGRIYAELFPELSIVREGFLGPDAGFDRVTYQLLERP